MDLLKFNNKYGKEFKCPNIQGTFTCQTDLNTSTGKSNVFVQILGQVW